MYMSYVLDYKQRLLGGKKCLINDILIGQVLSSKVALLDPTISTATGFSKRFWLVWLHVDRTLSTV